MAAIITIQTTGEGQGWAKEGTTGAAGARGTTCLEPLSMFFFFLLLLIFYLLNFYLHLELPWCRQSATTTTHHLHPQNECRLEAHLRLEFWYVNFFFVRYYIFRLCVRNHNQDDDGERPPPLGRWTGTWDASSVSRVSGMFFYFFRYVFSFFFFYYSFNLAQHVHHHHHYHPQWRELMSQVQVRFFLPLFYFSNY